MPSSFAENEFEDLFTEVAEDLGESIILHGDEDETITALITEEQDVSGGEGQADIRSTIRIRETDGTKLGDAAEVTFRDHRWHILEPLPPQSGMISVPVQRLQNENTRTQHFDLNDEQATWSS